MKLKYKDKVNCYYIPLVGFLSFVKLSEWVYGNPYEFVRKVVEKQKDLRFLAAGGFYYKEFVVLDSLIIKEIQIEQPHLFKKVDFLIYTDLFLKEGLLFKYADEWKKQRLLVSKSFSFSNLKDKFSQIKSTVLHYRSDLEKSLLRGTFESEQFSLSRHFMKISGEVILRGFLGKSQEDKIFFNEQQNILLSEELAEIIIEVGDECIDVFQNLKLRFLGKGYWHKEYLLSKKQSQLKKRLLAFRKILSFQIQQFILNSQNSQNSNNLLFHLLESNKLNPEETTQEQIEQQIMTFFFAGMDTTGFTSGMCFYLLAKYPEHFTKIQNEIQTLQIDEQKFEFEELNKLEYTNAFILETMRMYPVLALLIPRLVASKNGVYLDNNKTLFLDSQTLITIPLILNNYKKDVFEQPETFLPERWIQNSPEKIIQMKNYFLPFSNGPRNCIGQHLAMIEIKTIIVLYSLKFTPQLLPEKTKLKHVQRLMNQPLDAGRVQMKINQQYQPKTKIINL